MKQERMVQVPSEFIEEALWNRREDVKERRASDIHYKCIEEFIETIAGRGVYQGGPSYVIDNWLVNGEHGTYEDVWKYNFHEDEEYEGTDEQINRCRERCEDAGYFFDDDLEEYCSY